MRVKSEFVKSLVRRRRYSQKYFSDLLFIEDFISGDIRNFNSSLRFQGIMDKYCREIKGISLELDPLGYEREVSSKKKMKAEEKKRAISAKATEEKRKKDLRNAWIEAGGVL